MDDAALVRVVDRVRDGAEQLQPEADLVGSQRAAGGALPEVGPQRPPPDELPSVRPDS